MEKSISVSIPENIRAIFEAWGDDFDPAPYTMHGGHDPCALSALYKQLATQPGDRLVQRRALADVYRNADLNRQFGMVAELRQEGKVISLWIAGIVAGDPVLRASENGAPYS